MTLTIDLLSRGYFPDKIPPPFNTALFGECIANHAGPLPAGFDEKKIRELEVYDLGRPGQLRRRLAMPNPISYYHLAADIDSSWTEIQNHLSGSSLSLSSPVPGPDDGRAVVPEVEFADLPENRPLKRGARRFLLKTDVANFYSSIYTHSIPWALHTKPVAKANRTDSLFGNKLDRLTREAQFGQTKGIPVGPDTSLVIAEILLAPVDEEILKTYPHVVGFRHMDDFELACSSRTEAEELLANLQTYVSKYELQLNSFKTQIVELPASALDEWTRDISSFDFRDTAAKQRRDLLNYFDSTFTLSKRYPAKSVTAYALRRVAAQELLPDNWDLQEALTIQAAVGEPDALPQALEVLLKADDQGLTLNAELIGNALNEIVVAHAPLGHHSEVAWSIWAALALQYELSDAATIAISKVDNSVVALLALDARNNTVVQPSLDTTLWEAHMNADELHGPHWLLSYEATAKGWLATTGGNHVTADSAFSFLLSNDVTFYEEVDPDTALDALQGFLSRPSQYGTKEPSTPSSKSAN